MNKRETEILMKHIFPNKSIMSIRYEESVVLENDSLFIRSDQLPYRPVNNWNTIMNILLEMIGKRPEEKFGRESLLGLYWFWLRKE